jgi:predicted transcriptional regulator of viral defense system
MKWHNIEEKLENQGLTVFTSQELRRAAGLSPASAKHLLIRSLKRGVVLKLKERRGLYSLKRNSPPLWFLANRLLRPSYISLESAMAHHGAIPESVYGVTSVTPLITRTFNALGTVFTYHKVKKSAYRGYRPLNIEGTTVLVAEPEKALADYLYFVHLGKKSLNERIRWPLFDKELVMRYLRWFDRRGLMEWAKNAIPSHA